MKKFLFLGIISALLLPISARAELRTTFSDVPSYDYTYGQIMTKQGNDLYIAGIRCISSCSRDPDYEWILEKRDATTGISLSKTNLGTSGWSAAPTHLESDDSGLYLAGGVGSVFRVEKRTFGGVLIWGRDIQTDVSPLQHWNTSRPAASIGISNDSVYLGIRKERFGLLMSNRRIERLNKISGAVIWSRDETKMDYVAGGLSRGWISGIGADSNAVYVYGTDECPSIIPGTNVCSTGTKKYLETRRLSDGVVTNHRETNDNTSLLPTSAFNIRSSSIFYGYYDNYYYDPVPYVGRASTENFSDQGGQNRFPRRFGSMYDYLSAFRGKSDGLYFGIYSVNSYSPVSISAVFAKTDFDRNILWSEYLPNTNLGGMADAEFDGRALYWIGWKRASSGVFTKSFEILRRNTPPTPPVITGPTVLSPESTGWFRVSSVDDEGDTVRYGIDWDGDGEVNPYRFGRYTGDFWTGFYPSGSSAGPFIKSWPNIGTYPFRVFVEDSNGARNDSTYIVTVAPLVFKVCRDGVLMEKSVAGTYDFSMNQRSSTYLATIFGPEGIVFNCGWAAAWQATWTENNSPDDIGYLDEPGSSITFTSGQTNGRESIDVSYLGKTIGINVTVNTPSTLQLCREGVAIAQSGGTYNFSLSQGSPATFTAHFDTTPGNCEDASNVTASTPFTEANPSGGVISVSGSNPKTLTASASLSGTEAVTASYSGQSATLNATVSCVDTTNYCAQGAANTCSGETYTGTYTTTCGATGTCNTAGTRYCDFNWKEVAPGQ